MFNKAVIFFLLIIGICFSADAQIQSFTNSKLDITNGVITPNTSITNYSWVEMEPLNTECLDFTFNEEKNTIEMCLNDDLSAYPTLELNIFRGWKKLLSGTIMPDENNCVPELNVGSLITGKYLVVISSPDGTYNCSNWLKIL